MSTVNVYLYTLHYSIICESFSNVQYLCLTNLVIYLIYNKTSTIYAGKQEKGPDVNIHQGFQYIPNTYLIRMGIGLK